MSDPGAAAADFRRAAELNRHDLLRTGSLLEFPDYGQLVVTGDLHGHRRNFEKIRRYAQLDRRPHRHVILQELIHAESSEVQRDLSGELLLEAVRWQLAFPEQVHFLQSNHELAQLLGGGITKNGRSALELFDHGLAASFGTEAPAVREAIGEFIASLPLAARTATRIFCSHSLPNAREMGSFDPHCVRRTHTVEQMGKGTDPYRLVWGRRFTREQLDRLTDAWDVAVFIVGHQPQPRGWSADLDRVLTIGSDTNHGVLVAMDLSRFYDLDALSGNIIPLAGIE